MSSPPQEPAPDLEDELAAFRAQWRQEAERKRQQPFVSDSASTSSRPDDTQHRQRPDQAAELPQSPDRPTRRSIDAVQDELAAQVEAIDLETSPRADRRDAALVPKQRDREREREREAAQERARPKSALELYEFAVSSEREGRMQDGGYLPASQVSYIRLRSREC